MLQTLAVLKRIFFKKSLRCISVLVKLWPFSAHTALLPKTELILDISEESNVP